jgi:hypothetical protein
VLVRFVLCIDVVAMLLAPAEPARNNADVFEPVPIHVPPAARDDAPAGVNMHANYIYFGDFTIDLESERHVWVPAAEERPVPAWERSASERERCDRECRKAKRAQRRSERARGIRPRDKRSCPPVQGRRE